MLGIQTCLLLAALTAPANVEIVKFTSENCVPCQAMAPVLEQARARGFRVSEIDWDRQPELARQHGITAVPTLLIVTNGKIVDRIQGAVPAAELFARLDQVASVPIDNARDTQVRAALATRQTPTPVPATAGQSASDNRRPDNLAPADIERLALRATARIRVEDPDGQSYGTGTIVDSHDDEALVLTCGHLFRDSRGQGRIVVELLAPEAKQPVVGQLIRYDLKRDLALVGIHTKLRITPMPVAGPAFHVAMGQRLFSVGCNHGREPSIMRGQLLAVNKYLGPENLVVSGKPVDGRSGGGLFSYDGKLVGICNAADPDLNEGLYAAFASIHRHLDDAQLSFIYGGPSSREPLASAIADTGHSSDGQADGGRAATRRDGLPPIGSVKDPISDSRRLPRDDRNSGRSSSDSEGDGSEAALASFDTELAPLASGARGDEPNDAEVICIIRPKNGADTRSQVVVLERPSREFIQRLNHERTEQSHRQATQLRLQPRSASVHPHDDSPAKRSSRDRGTSQPAKAASERRAIAE